MSKIFVDQVDPKTATTLTLGTSGDTVSIPSGVTIANAGTATGFGVSLANGVDNRVVTSSSATALNGETNLTFDGNDLTVGNGNITFGTAAKGVYLGVTTATASNLLDDYEHGDWTPTWVLGTSGTQTTSTASGKYAKIGKFVTVWGYNAIGSTNSSPTGSIKIGGLPFTPASGYGQSNGFYGQGWVSGAWAWGDGASNGYHPRGITVRTDGLQLITYGVSPNQPYGPGYDMVGQTNTFYTGSSNHCQMYFGAVYRIA